jgi:hypothetical protein
MNRVDLTRSALDFTRALADNVVKGSSVIDVGKELYSWLVRERIHEAEYNYCTGLISAIAHPNDHGLQLRDSLTKVPPGTRKLGGLNVSQAGSVGRLMAFDIDYCYVVTTVAVVMEFHDMNFASTVLSNMALDKGGHQEGVDYPYDIKRTRIKPVITKIVDSIALNVVNSGHKLKALPDELSGQCVHVTDPGAFAAVSMAVQRASEDLVLLCDVLYGDLVAWIIAHFVGTFEISIAGKRIFEKRCGGGDVKATMVVVNRCSPMAEHHPNAGHDPSIELSINTSGVKKTVLHAIPNNLKGASPATRMALYDVSNISKRGLEPSLRLETVQSPLTPSDLIDIQVNAQAVLTWLLSTHIKPSDSFVTSVGFSVDLASNQGNIPNIGSLLNSWPGLSHKNFGAPVRSIVIFVPPSEISKGNHTQRAKDGGEVTWVEILECFPTIKTLLENIRPRCRCNPCRKEGPVDYNYLQPGCLQATALTVLLTLLSHAIADGFGAMDVSGICQSNPGVLWLAMQKVLCELIFDEVILWKTWFCVATFSVLGRSIDNSLEAPDVGADEGASELVAAQYGSLVVVAKWVDLTAQQLFEGSFGFHYAEGRLVGVGDEYAVVYSEKTMQPPEELGNNTWTFGADDDAEDPSADFGNLTDAWQTKDDQGKTSKTNVSVQTAIIGAGSPYRLLTMIKSDKYLRILDPSMILMALSRSEYFRCDHHGPHPKPVSMNLKHTSFWTFDELLGGWDTSNHTFDRDTQGVVLQMSTTTNNIPIFYVTTSQKTHLEFNISIGLSPFSGCLIKRPDDCLPCAMARLKERQGSSFGINGPRIVVRDIGIGPIRLIRS